MSRAPNAGRTLRIGRRRFLLGAASTAGVLLLPGCVGRFSRVSPHFSQPADLVLARAQEWLWSAQRDDGLFPSRTYGLMASGQSLTPFALDSLLQGGRDSLGDRGEEITAAVTAMLRLRGSSGALGLSASSPDYPCYATGLLLSCLAVARPSQWRDHAEPSLAWLRGQQFRTADGWARHPAQGGWGMGTRTPRTPPHAGHVDLSMTRRVVEGMRAAGVPSTDPAMLEARDFALRCQSVEGSFVYSPVELALNKGPRLPDGMPRGYGSATADGLLCLGALGLTGGPEFERAHAWLRTQHRPDRNPGLEGGPMEPFAMAMRGYYRAASARCFASWGGPNGWRPALQEAIAAEQNADGSLRNENGLQKEDDPIIATSFAIQALTAAMRPTERLDPDEDC